MSSIKQVIKRDKRIVPFDQSKITEAIWRAAQSVGGTDKDLAKKISGQVTTVLEVFYKSGSSIPTVDQIHDLVEKILIENGHAKTAKAYILYRQRHSADRGSKEAILGEGLRTEFSVNALKVLEQRCLKKNAEGEVVETPEMMFERVAENVAEADKKYGDFEYGESRKRFYKMMIELDFLPNSPTLMNAGTEVQQLASCFVLPLPNNVENIFDTLKKSAIIQKTGGGTGFNFSGISPRGDVLSSGGDTASGPVSFINVFDTASGTIAKASRRKGANMGILNVNHPDILEFIGCKEKEGSFPNFNLSVGITDEFMRAVENDDMFNLIDPESGKTTNSLHARSVFDLIVSRAWQNGEPGVVFLDRIEKDNPVPLDEERIVATNPCGEQPLLEYEACNLGSINVSRFVKNGKIDYPRLKEVVDDAVHFLDNVIDASDYKLPEVAEKVRANRKIGLGIMGFADLLYQLEVPYDSEDALRVAEHLMSFIQTESHEASKKLAIKRGSFPNFEKSVYPARGYSCMRNATVTTIAPTGTLSMIAETTPGIEPLFALVYIKLVLDGSELMYVNNCFENKAKQLNIYNQELMHTIARQGSLQKINGIPESLKRVYVVAGDISPLWQVQMQAVFQKFTDNAVSKTVSFPTDSTIEDVKQAFLLAYKLGCKGVAIYRDRSRKKQVLTHLDKREYQNLYNENNYVDNQTSLPFNNDTGVEESKYRKNTEEVIPPPISN